MAGDGNEAGPLNSLPLFVGVCDVHGGDLPLLTEAAVGGPGVHHSIQVEACPLQSCFEAGKLKFNEAVSVFSVGFTNLTFLAHHLA